MSHVPVSTVVLLSLRLVLAPLITVFVGLLVTVVVGPLVAVVVCRCRLFVIVELVFSVRLERRGGVSPVVVIMPHVVMVLALRVNLGGSSCGAVTGLLLLTMVLVVVRLLTLPSASPWSWLLWMSTLEEAWWWCAAWMCVLGVSPWR